MKRFFKYISFLIFSLSLIPLTAQELLYKEDFNQCEVPTNWMTNISYGDGIGFYVGQPTNPKSDSTSIDGTCMMVFDDDILGNNTPTFIAEVSTPTFSTMGYKTIRLHTDLHFRAYGTSTFSVYVEESDGNRILLAGYGEGQQTGSQFSDFAPLSLDLSFFTESPELKLVYIYDDKEMFAWWAGIDNVEVIGSGEGEIIMIEQFNDCGLPENWSTDILEGQHDWVFGLFENDKSSATSMNSSCFAFFDDDILTRDAPFSTADLMTPWFDGSQYATFILEMELIFRRYGDFENISVFVNDGENIKLVKEFFDAVGGPQLTNYVPIRLDLTEYRSNNMQIIFRYDDGNEWGWWTGIDNVKIIGNGSINDLCQNFEVLEIGKACLASDNKNAIFSGPPNTCFSNGEGSLWYALTAPDNGLINLSNEATYNDIITIYSGQCDALTEMSCTNRDEHGFKGEEVVFNAMKDQTYYIRISGIDAIYGLSRGKNCITAKYINQEPIPAPEDVFNMAIPLIINDSPYQIDNSHGNMEWQIPEDNLLARSDLWYTFNTNEFQNISVDIVSNFAENIVVYTEVFQVVHSQLEGGNFSLTELKPNAYFFIQISGAFAIIEGSAEIVLSALDLVVPESDDCFTNTIISIDEAIAYDNSGQTFSGNHSSCDIYADKDRWFSFVSDGSLVYLNVESDFIVNTTIYHGQCDSLEEYFCESALMICDGSIPISGLESGETYYLQISTSQTNNNNISGMMSFSMASEPIELPNLSLNVTAQCLENGYSELQIVVDSDVPYTLSGNSHGDMLFEGDTYIVVATPENGCEKSIKGIVNCQATSCNLTVESYLTYPSCQGSSDGSIDIDVQNGLGPFSYSWAHTEDDVAQFVSLGSGEYFVTITDALGCVSSTSVMIEEPNPIVSMVNFTDQSIAGIDDGTATVEISGGTLPYSFQWSNESTDPMQNNLAPGEYSVTITDYNGCTTSHEVIINELDCIFSVEAELVNVTCFGGNDASIDLSSVEDIESVEWDNDAVGTTLNNIGEGIFTATIMLENGCNKIESFTISQPEPITFESDIANVKCFGESNGEITPIISGGNGDFSYAWDDDGSNELLRSNLTEGMYTLSVTDHLGCTEETIFSITQPDLLEVASAMVTDLSCADSQDGQLCVFVEGGTQPYQFDWEDLENGMAKMTDLTAGTYNLLVTDLNQCTLTAEQTISAPLPLEVTVESISISEDNNGEISINVQGGVEPYEITWFVNNEIVGSGMEISDLAEGIYRAEIIDANGCTLDTPDLLLSPTSITELIPSEYTVYPNPARSSFTISWSNVDKKLSVKIISVTGQDLSHLVDFSFNNESIQCSNNGLVSGLYYLEIGKFGETESERLPLIIAEF